MTLTEGLLIGILLVLTFLCWTVWRHGQQVRSFRVSSQGVQAEFYEAERAPKIPEASEDPEPRVQTFLALRERAWYFLHDMYRREVEAGNIPVLEARLKFLENYSEQLALAALRAVSTTNSPDERK